MYESWKWLVCAMLLGIATGTTIATVLGGGLGTISTTKGGRRPRVAALTTPRTTSTERSVPGGM